MIFRAIVLFALLLVGFPAHADLLLTGVGPAGSTGAALPFAYPAAVQVINMVSNSQGSGFANAFWTKTGVQDTTFSTTTTAPDGSQNAVKLIANSSDSAHNIVSTSIPRSGFTQSYRWSADVAPAGYTRVVLECQNAAGTTGVQVTFDVAGGQVGIAPATFGSGWTAGAASLTAIGNNFYRLIFDFNPVAVTPIQCSVFLDAGSGTGAQNDVFAGNGVNGVWLWQVSLLPTPVWSFALAFSDPLTSSATFDLTNSKAPGFNWYLNNQWPNAGEPGGNAWKTTVPTVSTDLSFSSSGVTLANDVHSGTKFGNDLSTAVTDAITGNTNAVTTSGNVLHFAAVPAGVANGDFVYDNTGNALAAIPASTTVLSFTTTTVTLSANVIGSGVASGDQIGFSPVGYVGKVFGGPLLFDITMDFSASFAASGLTSWPTYFGLAMEFLSGAQCQNYGELDGFEAFPTGTGTFENLFGEHIWVTCTGIAQTGTNFTPSLTQNFPARYSKLWIPAAANTTGTNGLYQIYYNGVYTGAITGVSSEINYTSGSSPNYILTDGDHYPMILGTGVNWPNTLSNARVFSVVVPVAGYTATGPASGAISVPSTNFTVTLATGTFNGSETITIADGSEGGTLTPSVGSPGTSTVTVTPTNGTTSFTFTYTPVVNATVTLTFTNSASLVNPPALSYAAGASCTQSANVQARMDGAQNASAVDALICGMVSDGTYSGFDGLYVFATNSTANAVLNWAQNAFNLTTEGTLTFAANQGYTSNGTTGYFQTGFVPSTAGGNFTQNAASLGSCTLTSRTASQAYIAIGANDGTEGAYSETHTTAWFYALNASSGGSTTSANAQGFQYLSRTTSTNINAFSNNTTPSVVTKTSNGVPTIQLYVMGYNNSGTAGNFDADQVAYVFFGGTFTTTQIGNIHSRLHTYLQAVGETTAC